MGAGAALIMPATLSLLVSVFTDTARALDGHRHLGGDGRPRRRARPRRRRRSCSTTSRGARSSSSTSRSCVARARRRTPARCPSPATRSRARIDWPGAALSVVGLVALVWAVIEAPSEGWTSRAGARCRRARRAPRSSRSCVWQRRAAAPLLDVRLFRDPRFSAASGTIMVLFFALFGFLFLSTQYLQFVLGYSPSAAGVRALPYAGAMIVCAPLSAALVARLGRQARRHGRDAAVRGRSRGGRNDLARAPATAGSPWPFVLMGAGMGFAGAPATESIMDSLPPERANTGSAVNDTTRELGGALGVAVVGSIMSSLYASGAPPATCAAAAREFVAAMSRARSRRGRGRARRGHRVALAPGPCGRERAPPGTSSGRTSGPDPAQGRPDVRHRERRDHLRDARGAQGRDPLGDLLAGPGDGEAVDDRVGDQRRVLGAVQPLHVALASARLRRDALELGDRGGDLLRQVLRRDRPRRGARDRRGEPADLVARDRRVVVDGDRDHRLDPEAVEGPARLRAAGRDVRQGVAQHLGMRPRASGRPRRPCARRRAASAARSRRRRSARAGRASAA